PGGQFGGSECGRGNSDRYSEPYSGNQLHHLRLWHFSEQELMKAAGFTRRQFSGLLQAGGAMAAAGVRPSSVEAKTLAGENGVSVTRRRFEPLVGSGFRVDGKQISLTLISFEDTGRRGARGVDCSLLRFSAAGPALAEGSYRLVHEQLGECELYLNPGKPGRYLAH